MQFQWFQATNNPIEDPLKPVVTFKKNEGAVEELQQDLEQQKLIQKVVSTGSTTVWQPFNYHENQALEDAFHNQQGKCIVGDDYLYEVDIKKRQIYPIYWSGAKHAVIRALWFVSEGNHFVPLDEGMGTQIEDGYLKHKPNEVFSHDHEPVENKVKVQYKWQLFGQYAASKVVYTWKHGGWLLKDDVTSHITQSIYQTLSSGENLGGQKIIRGWNKVLKQGVRKDSLTVEERNKQEEELIAQCESRKREWHEGKKNIRHLVFGIHGIGQAMGTKSTSVNFIEDINNLRITLSNSLKNNIIPYQEKKSGERYKVPGVAVLPIEWRKGLSFDQTKKADQEMPGDQEFPSIEDITIDSVSTFRSIVTDCLLDVLLYMEPRHKAEIISRVINEMNRVYKLFTERHPTFLEDRDKPSEVHVYSHSLGSVLMMDIVTYHHDTKQSFWQSNQKQEPKDRASTHLAFNEKYPELLRRKARKAYLEQSSVKVQLNFAISKSFMMGSPFSTMALIKSKKVGVTLGTMLEFYETWFKENQQFDDDLKQSLIEELWDEFSNQILHPHCGAIYNIFQPTDPVASKFEPLVLRTLNQKPYVIHPGKPSSGIMGTYELAMSASTEISAKASGFLGGLQSFVASLAIKRAQEVAKSQSPQAEKQQFFQPEKSDRAARASQETMNSIAPPAPHFSTEEVLHTLNPRHQRLDFVLSSGLLENQYLSAISAHFNYWKDDDIGTFVMNEILENPIE